MFNVKSDSDFKHFYALLMLIVLFMWAVFAVWITVQAIATLKVGNILAASGVDTVLGALIVWNADIKQFYFRKKPTNKPEDDK